MEYLPILHFVRLRVTASTGVHSVGALGRLHQIFVYLVLELENWICFIKSYENIVFNLDLIDSLRHALVVLLNLVLQGVHLRFQFLEFFCL